MAAMPGKSASEILSLALCELRKRRALVAGKSPSAQPSPSRMPSKLPSKLPPASGRPPKIAASKTPRPSLSSKYIPAALRQDVAQRDGHRCTYVVAADSGADGTRRCEAIHQLEFDHVNPRAFGGQNTLANLRLLCRAHNNLAAKDLMGKEFIESRYRHG